MYMKNFAQMRTLKHERVEIIKIIVKKISTTEIYPFLDKRGQVFDTVFKNRPTLTYITDRFQNTEGKENIL